MKFLNNIPSTEYAKKKWNPTDKKEKALQKSPTNPLFGFAPTTHEKCLIFVLYPTSANSLLYQ